MLVPAKRSESFATFTTIMTLEQLDRCPSTFRSDQSNGASPLGDNHQTETHFAQSDTCFNFVGVPKCFPPQMLSKCSLLQHYWMESVSSVFQFKLESVIKHFRLQILVLISMGKSKSLTNNRWADIVKQQEQSI